MDNQNNETIYITCPHCLTIIEVPPLHLNCAIFRHGIYKHNFTPMNPHASKKECDFLVKNNAIYGCGKPFKILRVDNTYKAEVCEYI